MTKEVALGTAVRIARAILQLLALSGLLLNLVAILAALFPGSSGEWSGLGIVIPAMIAVVLGLLMFPLILTQSPGRRRGFVTVALTILVLPLVAVGASRLGNYYREVAIYRPLEKKLTAEMAHQNKLPVATTPKQVPQDAGYEAPRSTNALPAPHELPTEASMPACIRPGDSSYPLALARQRLMDIRDNRQHWEELLAHNHGLQVRYPNGYQGMLDEALETYIRTGGAERDPAAVSQEVPLCGRFTGTPQIPPISPISRPPPRSGVEIHAIQATKSITIPPVGPRTIAPSDEP